MLALNLAMGLIRRPQGHRFFAAQFDGTNDWLGEPATSTTTPAYAGMLGSGNDFTFSCWFKPASFSLINMILNVASTNSNRLAIRCASTTGRIGYEFRDTLGNLIGSSGGIVGAELTLNAWNHIYVALGSSNFDIYLNNSSKLSAGVGFADIIDGAKPLRIGAQGSAIGNKLNGSLAELWYKPEYLAPATYYSKFYAAGSPANLGANGELVTGAQPLIYLKFADPLAMGKNSGSGANLAVNGALVQEVFA